MSWGVVVRSELGGLIMVGELRVFCIKCRPGLTGKVSGVKSAMAK